MASEATEAARDEMVAEVENCGLPPDEVLAQLRHGSSASHKADDQLMQSAADLIEEGRRTEGALIELLAKARAERLRETVLEVLAPFARVAELDIGDDEADSDWFRQAHFLTHNKSPRITIGDLRRAGVLFAALRARTEDSRDAF